MGDDVPIPFAITTSFFDPNDNGFDIGDIGIYVAGLVGISVLAGIVLRWYSKKAELHAAEDRKMIEASIKDYIDAATLPIQPNTNGGFSMSDLHVKVDQVIEMGHLLKANQAVIQVKMDSLEKSIPAIQQDIHTIRDRHNVHIDDHKRMKDK